MEQSPDGALVHRSWANPHVAANAPIALLLHGITGSSGTWWRLGPALADAGWRVFALDLPGHGESPRMGRPMKAQEWALSIRRSLSDLVAGRPVDLAIGHSAGAATLLEVAALDSRVARRIVLEDPPGAGDESRPGWAQQLEREVSTARRDPRRMERLLLRQNPRWQAQDATEAVGALRACEIETIAEMERRGMGYRTAGLVPTVEVPSLLMLAEEGRSALTGDAREMVLGALPGSMRPRFFSTGHVIHRDAFDDYLRAILGWLDRSAAA